MHVGYRDNPLRNHGFSESPVSFAWNIFLLLLVGFFVGGPINMIASSIVADLGKSKKLKDNAEALSTVTGIIDGSKISTRRFKNNWFRNG